MPVANVRSSWISGNLRFREAIAGNGAQIHFGFDETGLDVKMFGATSGASVLFDESADEMIFTKTKISFAGALGTADHVIDFSGITPPSGKNLIRAGSYSSPLAYPAAGGGMLNMYYSNAANTGASTATFFYGVTTGTGAALGTTALVESNAATPGPAGLQGGQFMAGLRAGKYLATAAGDATAGMYGAWVKVYASTTSVASSGCKVAAIWLDNQMNCAVGGEEYAAYITTGGSVPDAVFGLNTSSGGWAALLNFDSTMASKPPLSTLACADAASDSSIIIKINGETRYIPVYNSAT